jgi:hypothetical protein
MSKNLYFLISIVLLLGVNSASGTVALDVNNYSFEYDVNGVQIVDKTGIQPPYEQVLAWKGVGNWSGATIWCESPLYDANDPNTLCNFVGATDGHVSAWINGADIYIYQVTDHIFEADRRYILTFDGQGWGATFTPSLFYPLDANFPDVNHIDVWGEEMLIESEVPVGPDKYELDIETVFTTVPGQAYIGKHIGIKFFNAADGSYVFIDNVRLSHKPATQAGNPSPKNRATDVTIILEEIGWAAGIEAFEHDVYFGTDFNNVNDANNSDPVGPGEIYKARQSLGATTYPLPADLEFNKKYYWRIDEVNDPCLWKGDVWSFTASDHLTVDDFESYVDDTALKAVWKDYWYDTASKNGAEVFVETDPNFVNSGEQSMRYYYVNNSKHKVGGKHVGSWAEAATADLQAGTDWTVSGAKALTLYFYGDAGNGQDTTGLDQDQMYVELVSGGASALIEYPDMNAVMEDWWHEWNIELQDFNDGGVTLSSVDTVYIGFGGYAKTGQTSDGAGAAYGLGDNVYFDDIEVWPPRCVPLFSKGEGDSDEDCFIDYSDVDAIGRDWLEYGGMVTGVPPDANLLAAWYKFDEGVDQTVVNYGTYGATHNGMLGNSPAVDACDPLWITNDPCAARQRCLEFDGATEYVEIPPFDFNTNTLTISAWVKRNRSQEIFAGIVVAADPCIGNTKAGLQFGSTPGWNPTNTLNYTWPDDGPPYTWEFQSDLLVPEGEWAFVAVTIAPSEGVLYRYDGTMSSATNLANQHYVEEFDCVTDIGWNRSKGVTKRHFDGRIDDVRIYNYTLSADEILYVANPVAMYYQALEDWRADADGDDRVDFKDYVIMANNWLDEVFWPAP